MDELIYTEVKGNCTDCAKVCFRGGCWKNFLEASECTEFVKYEGTNPHNGYVNGLFTVPMPNNINEIEL